VASPLTVGGKSEGLIVGTNYTGNKSHREEVRKLNQALNRKDIIIDVINHDISNALNVILGYGEIALDEVENGELKKQIEIIKRNAQKIDRIMNNSVKVAKLEKMENFRFKNLDLSEVIDEVLNDHKSMLEEKNINIEKKFPEDIYVKANDIIEDVFSNLISNAIKFSPESSTVAVKVEDETDNVVVKVIDNGPGIPEEHKGKVFERLVKGRKEGIRGSGLGLSIVKGIVDLHQGDVWVEDNPEGGSIFAVRLPKEVDSSPRKPAQEAGNHREPAPSPTHGRILIVDDDFEIRYLLKKVIDTEEVEVLEASSGAEALDIIHSQKVELIFLDIMMPGLDGWEVARKIKEDPETRDITVFMLSVKKSSEDIEKSFSYANADDHLTKPFSAELIRNKIESTLRN